MVDRELKFRGYRESTAAKEFYPDAPGVAVLMCDCESIDAIRLSFRAIDLMELRVVGSSVWIDG